LTFAADVNLEINVPEITAFPGILWRESKAVASLRYATALQDAGAELKRWSWLVFTTGCGGNPLGFLASDE
jgi:hypothetical protein